MLHTQLYLHVTLTSRVNLVKLPWWSIGPWRRKRECRQITTVLNVGTRYRQIQSNPTRPVSVFEIGNIETKYVETNLPIKTMSKWAVGFRKSFLTKKKCVFLLRKDRQRIWTLWAGHVDHFCTVQQWRWRCSSPRRWLKGIKCVWRDKNVSFSFRIS